MISGLRKVKTSIPAISTPHPLHARLLSLDVLRGLTVAVMIAVNNAGNGRASYPQLRHSVWNGCTLTDLVFPCFLFMVGISIDLAFQKRLAQGVRRSSLVPQILKRALLIFAIGLLINALPFFHLADLRYCGVLQRIAACYLLASLVYLFGGLTASAIVTALALIGYWWLMLHVRVPGFGMPGVDIAILDRTGNLASWLDRTIIPVAHIYRHTVYDPEGILSTLPALATTLLGTLAAAVLRTTRSANRQAITLFIAGVVMLGLGLLWSDWFPLNKRVWTSSYVLFAGGISTLLLALLFWLIDGPVRIRRGLTPWLVFGTNALTAYIVSEVLAIFINNISLSDGDSVQEHVYHLIPQVISPSFTSMLYSILFVLVCAIPVAILYQRKIFIKL
jgi:predicted acyltransferase